MSALKSIIIAFSMFSKIPMPTVSWDKKSMRFMMCAFPLVGLVVGAACFGWLLVCDFAGVGVVLRSVGFIILPVALTGGIHLDGFCDTIDALSSHADTEKKLEILKDSHTGAFAIIGVVSYFLLYFALLCELDITANTKILLCFGFFISRVLSGIAVAGFPLAKNSGLVHTFADMGAKKVILYILIFTFIVTSSLFVSLYGIFGLAACCVSLVVFIGYYLLAKKQFGGTTGDIAGWFVQVCELFWVAIIVALQMLLRVI